MIESGSGKVRIVVIGASAAGLRCASRAKRLMPGAEITVLDAGKVVSLAACGLPYYLSGDIENPRKLVETSWGTIRNEEYFKDVKGLDVRTQTLATRVDPKEKIVYATDLVQGTSCELPYDKLVFATGAAPISLPGVAPNHPRVSVLRTLEDAKAWREKLEANAVDRVAIIGSGYIGLELCEAFGGLWGCEVDLIEMENRILPQSLDPEMAVLVEAHLKQQGVTVHKACCVKEIRDMEGGLEIVAGDRTIETQFAVMGLGVRPRVDVAIEAGVKLGQRGGIAVDERLQTSVPDIYAAGDCIESELVCGAKIVVPLGSLANKQGRALGDILAGRDVAFGKIAASACVKVFDFNVATTGLTETLAKRIGISCRSVLGTFGSIAHYYPEDKNIFVKLVYRPEDHKVLGLQAVGEGEVVKRVDVLGNLLKNGGRLEDLLELEFAYAPPFAPALDPIYVLGAAALNQEDGVVSVGAEVLSDAGQLIDARTAGEAEANPVPGAIHIALEEIRLRYGELDKNRPVTVICAKGARSAEVARFLLNEGFAQVVYVGGGWVMHRK